jgi:hypothetical protein
MRSCDPQHDTPHHHNCNKQSCDPHDTPHHIATPAILRHPHSQQVWHYLSIFWASAGNPHLECTTERLSESQRTNNMAFCTISELLFLPFLSIQSLQELPWQDVLYKLNTFGDKQRDFCPSVHISCPSLLQFYSNSLINVQFADQSSFAPFDTTYH